MARWLRRWIAKAAGEPLVRPWGMLVPLLILLICLPMLVPLRRPAEEGPEEALRLASIEAIVRDGALALPEGHPFPPEQVRVVDGRAYAAQPPALAVLLSWPAELLQRLGVSFEDDRALIRYALTLIGSTLPAVVVAGLVYRMGRLFELRRPWRVALAASAVAGGGLLSYAVVLNGAAPASCLALLAAAMLVRVSMSTRPARHVPLLMLSGLAAALAGAIEPRALVLAAPLWLLTLLLPLGWPLRLGALLLMTLGAVPALLLHMAWAVEAPVGLLEAPALLPRDELSTAGPVARAAGQAMERLVATHVGARGLFSHFPLCALGALGALMVLRRHWPRTTKLLAAITMIAAGLLTLAPDMSGRADEAGAFARPAHVLFTPLLLLWCGAWLKRPHSRGGWLTAALLLLVSVGISVAGMFNPAPRDGYRGFTAAEALQRLLEPDGAIETRLPTR